MTRIPLFELLRGRGREPKADQDVELYLASRAKQLGVDRVSLRLEQVAHELFGHVVPGSSPDAGT